MCNIRYFNPPPPRGNMRPDPACVSVCTNVHIYGLRCTCMTCNCRSTCGKAVRNKKEPSASTSIQWRVAKTPNPEAIDLRPRKARKTKPVETRNPHMSQIDDARPGAQGSYPPYPNVTGVSSLTNWRLRHSIRKNPRVPKVFTWHKYPAGKVRIRLPRSGVLQHVLQVPPWDWSSTGRYNADSHARPKVDPRSSARGWRSPCPRHRLRGSPAAAINAASFSHEWTAAAKGGLCTARQLKRATTL